MSYTKVYNARKFFGIRKILEDLLELPPGSSYDIEGSSEMLGRVRWLVYDWLAHMELKEEFRVKRLQGRLVVERKKPLEVRGRGVGTEEEEIDKAVERSLDLLGADPGEVLRGLLSGDMLGRGLKKLARILDEDLRDKNGREPQSKKAGKDTDVL